MTGAHWGDGTLPCHIEINHPDEFNKHHPAQYPFNGGSAMTENQILDICAKRIAEVERQRDRARRELSRARKLLREMQIAHTADIEAHEDNDSYACRVWDRVDRFLAKPKPKRK